MLYPGIHLTLFILCTFVANTRSALLSLNCLLCIFVLSIVFVLFFLFVWYPVAAVGVPACRSDVLGPAKEQAEVRGGYLWWCRYGALHPVLCCAVLAEEGWSQVRGGPVCVPAYI